MTLFVFKNIMIIIQNEIIKCLTAFGIPLVLVLFIIYILFCPDKAQKIAGWIQYFFGYVLGCFKKASIKNRLESSCSKMLNKFGKELPELSIPKLSIEWIRGDQYDTELKEGEAIIKLQFSKDQTKNIVNAASVYVRDSFLKHSKPYMNDSLRQAIDLSITRKILLKIDKNQRNILSQFNDDNSIRFDQCRNECNQVESVDDVGLLTRVLIREFDYFGDKLQGRIPNEKYKKEADNFLTYLFDIATRAYDENTKLQFVESTLKVGILLVARLDTYSSAGLDPYLRRIKLGFARGIETFYLLAREDKVQILESVATALLKTGIFTLINKPKVFKDQNNRDNLCYCLRVDQESSIASSFKSINDAMKNDYCIQGVITKVRKDKLFLNCDGVEGFISKNNLSTNEISNPHDYFKENIIISLKPIEINSDGIVECSLIGTNSDPYKLINSCYSIGNEVEAKVNYVDDDFIKMQIDDSQTTAIAFRKDLTYSKFLILNDKFKKDTKWNFTIKEIEFEKNQLVLRFKDLTNPWSNINLESGIMLDFVAYKKNSNSFVGEIQEGIMGLLPYSELSWFDNQVDSIVSKIKLGEKNKCWIKSVDKEKQIVLLTLKDYANNPYCVYYQNNKDKMVDCVLFGENDYGLIGEINEVYRIFIPQKETKREDNVYPYKINKNNRVFIIDLSQRKDSLIGSFKPLIPFPLQSFSNKYKEGKVLSNLKRTKTFNEGICFAIKDGKRSYEATLFKGEICDLCYVNSCIDLFGNIDTIPLMIKEIDLERNRILLSLKDLLNLNHDRASNLKYDQTFDAIILGKNQNNYAVLLINVWIDCYLETEKVYSPGDKLELRVSSLSADPIIMTDS